MMVIAHHSVLGCCQCHIKQAPWGADLPERRLSAQEMDNSGRVGPSPELLRRCGYVFGAEILIDLTKHAVLAKLNDIRPTVYQRFMRVRA